MKKLVIYDFCQTLVNFETADEFALFVLKKENALRFYFGNFYRKLLEKFHIMNHLNNLTFKQRNISSFKKRTVLKAIKGLKKDEIYNYGKEFYFEYIKPNLILPVIETLKKYQREGYEIIIISASYEPILRWFCEDFHVELLITNDFAYDEQGYFLGDIMLPDCAGKKKVDYFYQQFPTLNLKECESIAYGDGESDLPILLEAKKGIVVSHIKSKKWAQVNDLEELIW